MPGVTITNNERSRREKTVLEAYVHRVEADEDESLAQAGQMKARRLRPSSGAGPDMLQRCCDAVSASISYSIAPMSLGRGAMQMQIRVANSR